MFIHVRAEKVFGNDARFMSIISKANGILAGGFARDFILDLGEPKDYDVFVPTHLFNHARDFVQDLLDNGAGEYIENIDYGAGRQYNALGEVDVIKIRLYSGADIDIIYLYEHHIRNTGDVFGYFDFNVNQVYYCFRDNMFVSTYNPDDFILQQTNPNITEERISKIKDKIAGKYPQAVLLEHKPKEDVFAKGFGKPPKGFFDALKGIPIVDEGRFDNE
ncbi:hypothetical protein NVP1262O_57 [Vibrio phage 1.262.O._10N.286.51.A9]|nr:hypothetical protein NVP1262O_57 [Vibrio phage 1.262.O._10N.286.51.A9]